MWTEKKPVRFSTGRATVVTLSILLQLGLLSGSLLLLSRRAYLLALVLRAVSLVVAVWIISKADNPSFKLSWVFLILAAPLLGGIIYLLYGNKRLPRGLRRQIDRFYYAALCGLRVDSGCEPDLRRFDEQLAVQSAFIRRSTGFPAWSGTAGEFFALGDDLYPRLLEELERAERFIFMEYFIIARGSMWDSVLKILRRKRAEGVEIRIMYDDIGCIATLPSGYDKTLREMGFSVTVFNPYRAHLNMSMNYRDHRKLCVIDGNIGFCGGVNIADEYVNRLVRYGHWKDTAVLLRGDGVWNLTLMFLALWGFANAGETIDFQRYIPTLTCPSDGFVQPFGDSPLDSINVAETVYLQIINRASEYLYLTTPYLVPDNELITALGIAAQSGVDVRIITPHIPDKRYMQIISRSYYPVLLRCGVRIFEYEPGFMHAKQMVSDDKVAVVGTANIDFRSLYLHFECGVAFFGAGAVWKVRDDVLSTLNCCREIRAQDAARFPLLRRLLAAALRVVAPLL